LTESELIASARYLVDSEGKKDAVLVDIAVWEELLDTLRKEQKSLSLLYAQIKGSRQVQELNRIWQVTLDKLQAQYPEENVPREILDRVLVLFFEEIAHSDYYRIPETMLLSESVLNRDWDTPEEDEAWANL
jgi:hypothetical protein